MTNRPIRGGLRKMAARKSSKGRGHERNLQGPLRIALECAGTGSGRALYRGNRLCPGAQCRCAGKSGGCHCGRRRLCHGPYCPGAEFQYRGNIAAAQTSKLQALQCMEGVTRRERQHIEALARAVDGDGPGALALIREHVQAFPRDAFLLKQADGPFGLIGFGGGQDRLEANFTLLDSVGAAYGDDWWFLSAYAFARNELGYHEKARHLVQRALERHPQSGHSAHTMAHVFFETGDHSGGVAFLGSWLPDFPRQAQIYSHPERVLELYDQTLNPTVCPGAPLIALCDAAALLWRHDLYGLQRPPGAR